MIRKYKIFCLAQLGAKYSEDELYRSSIQSINLNECLCINCGEIGHFKRHAKYNRYLVEGCGEDRKEVVIEIERFKCTECNTTHAYIPSFIIPFSAYSLRFVFKVLFCYFQKRHTIEQICNKYNISMSILYKWVDLFKKCKNKWIDALEEVLVSDNRDNNGLSNFIKSILPEDFIRYVFCDKVFVENYQYLFGQSFMEKV